MAILTDLVVWQLADELRNEVFRLVGAERVHGDFRFRDQIRSAVSGVAANIAEGYGRRSHAEFARFLDFAMGSLRETENWLLDGAARGYWTSKQTSSAKLLCKRLTVALNNLRKYLRSTQTP
ncbi:MAG: four helix bundle protein [Acidobacteria bacterium]|nr:MAG: four helix bundle protein [Acidobacteriota bacterium]